MTAMGSLPTWSSATAPDITIRGGPELNVVYRVERREALGKREGGDEASEERERVEKV